MNIFTSPIKSSSFSLIDRIQQELDSFEYDYEAIKTDDKRKSYPVLKPAKKVEKTRSCICQDGVFYSMWKSQDVIEDLCLYIYPYVQHKNGEVKMGYRGHVMHLFQGEDGKYGAISKSSIPQLRFQEPVYTTIRNLAINPSIINGFKSAICCEEKQLKGLEYYVINIRKKFIEFEKKVTINTNPITQEDLFDIGVCFF